MKYTGYKKASDFIDYQVQYSKRKTMGIYVSPEQGVQVRAPYFVSASDVHQFVQSKQSWILKQLRHFSDRKPPFEPRFDWGEQLYYLGDKVVFHCLSNPGVDLLIPGKPNDSPEQIERRVQRYLRQSALAYFSQRHQYWTSRMATWKLPPSSIGIRSMKRRWGSCRRNGNIVLNAQLIKYPPACVDAVVVHEMCHLLEFNHSSRFYQLMDQVLPEWRLHDRSLNELSLLY